MQPVLVAYIPVLHEGYRRLFENHPEARELYLFGNDVIGEFEHLAKDIRRLDPELIKKAIESWKRFDRVSILDTHSIQQLRGTSLIVSDDDITQELVQKHFPDSQITKDTIFLRWDKKKSIEPMHVSPDIEMSEKEFDREMMQIAQDEAGASKDWWRRIGAVCGDQGWKSPLSRAQHLRAIGSNRE
jgi:dCMP deaminase